MSHITLISEFIKKQVLLTNKTRVCQYSYNLMLKEQNHVSQANGKRKNSPGRRNNMIQSSTIGRRMIVAIRVNDISKSRMKLTDIISNRQETDIQSLKIRKIRSLCNSKEYL